jgi:hypothetical protein
MFRLIYLPVCFFLLSMVIEAQTLPGWVTNPPRDTVDTIHILMKGTGKTLQEARESISRENLTDTETSWFDLNNYYFESTVAGNTFSFELVWDNWFVDNATLIDEFYTQAGGEITYYILYSMPRKVYNILNEVIYWYVPAFKDGSIENALYLSASQLAKEIPRNLKVAVISFLSDDKELGEFALEEITGYLSSSGTMRLFDRRSLDSIRREQGFQTTGDVDDKSAVSIGQFAGADVVITGSITGSGSTRRMRFKALDVKTATILSQTSYRF